jgi:hypothetical protein
MSGMDVYKKIDSILKRLYVCTEKAQIDELFVAEQIDDYTERLELLHKCMGVEDVYNTPEKITLEDEYDFECAIFVEGTWRLLN